MTSSPTTTVPSTTQPATVLRRRRPLPPATPCILSVSAFTGRRFSHKPASPPPMQLTTKHPPQSIFKIKSMKMQLIFFTVHLSSSASKLLLSEHLLHSVSLLHHRCPSPSSPPTRLPPSPAMSCSPQSQPPVLIFSSRFTGFLACASLNAPPSTSTASAVAGLLHQQAHSPTPLAPPPEIFAASHADSDGQPPCSLFCSQFIIFRRPLPFAAGPHQFFTVTTAATISSIVSGRRAPPPPSSSSPSTTPAPIRVFHATLLPSSATVLIPSSTSVHSKLLSEPPPHNIHADLLPPLLPKG